jgi:competence protein ComEC
LNRCDFSRNPATSLDTVKNPLLPPLAALATGILASHLLTIHVRDASLGLAAMTALALFAAWRAKRVLISCSLTAALMLGALLEAIYRPGTPPQIDAGPREVVALTGCVVSPPAFYQGRDQFTVELAPHARAQVGMTVREGETPPDLHYGQRIAFEARIQPPRNFQNPGAFDYRGFLARSHIY